MKLLVTAIIFLTSFSLRSQDSMTFVEKVNDCYSDKKFEDIIYQFQNERNCFIGLEFPVFEKSDINGKKYSEKDFKDKVVVMNFWFAACPPCLKEIPHIDLLIEKYKESDVLFLAPTTDDEATAKEFLSKHPDFKNTVLPDSKNLFRETLASRSGFPTIIVINKKGIITEYFGGGLQDFSKLELLIEKLLSE